MSAKYYFRPNDENRGSGFGDPRGWRATGTLKCDACRQPTRHAIIHAASAEWFHLDEVYQHYALGGEWFGKYEPDRKRLQSEYQRHFPRNPKLRHWFDTTRAVEARERGETEMPALCGDIGFIPRSWNKGDDQRHLVAPGQVDWETEFEDPETGMSWVDMDCVNCLRVTNERRLRGRRQLLERLLAWFALHPERVPDGDVEQLLTTLDRLAEPHRHSGENEV